MLKTKHTIPVFLLVLLMMLSAKPLFIIHDNQIFLTGFYDYTEKNFGGNTSVLMNYHDKQSLELIKNGFVPPYGFGTNIDFTENQHLQPFSQKHLLGTNGCGQDFFSYLLIATIFSTAQAILLTILSSIPGLILGQYLGFYNARLGRISIWILESFRSVSLAALIIIALSTPGVLISFLFMFILTQWSKQAVTIRARTIENMSAPYLLDAKLAGYSDGYILRKFILRSNLTFLFETLPHLILYYLTILTNLEYFGLSLFPETPSLGKMILDSQQHPDAFYLILVCVLCLILLSQVILKTSSWLQTQLGKV